jgi:predicted permease
MNSLLFDLRFAVRALRKNLGFSVVAICTLAVAIAATTTIFAVVDAAIIRPLPFAEPDRLVRIWEMTPEGADFSASEPDYLDFARDSRALAALGAFRTTELALTDDDPRRLNGLAVSHTLFATLGVRPLIGRTFLPDEDAAGRTSSVVVLSHALWQSRFHGDSSVVGQTASFNGRPHTIIGVMPSRFRFPDADAFVPLHASAASRRGDHWLSLVGRLRSDATADGLRADLARSMARIGAEHPGSAGWGARVESLFDSLVDRNFQRAGWVLLAATGLLLMLGCANVANLLLARATTRQTEMGVRTALGAGRSRIVRHWLTESALLVAVASTLGITGAMWATTAVHAFGAGRIPRVEEVSVDARVIAATVLLGVVTTLLCGLVPAVRVSRVDPASVLGDGARAGASRRHRQVRNALAVVQIGLSVMLLVGAGLMLRSFDALSTGDVGFDARHVLAVKLDLPSRRYDESQQAVFYRRLTARLRALPGVRAVGATAVDPFSGWNFMNDITPEDRARATSGAGFMQAAWRAVTPGFFDAMGMKTVSGRTFTNDDLWNGPPLVVVSRSVASRVWPNEDPVGKRMFWGGVDGTPRTVIGVVNDIRDIAPESPPLPTIFLNNNQVPMPSMTVVVRTAGDPTPLIGSVRTAVHSLDPSLPADDIHALSRNRLDALTTPRFNLALMSALAVLALVLAASGIYSVIAFSVVQRHREIGIRLAMGAAPRGVVAFFVRSGATVIVLGLAAGIALAWIAASFMDGMLYGVAPNDALTYVTVAIVLAVIAMAASYIPARRAAHVDPLTALR